MKDITTRKRWKTFALVITILFILSTLFYLPVKVALVFEYQNKGHIIAYLPLHKKDHFTIRYIHSIHLTPVIEDYYVNTKNQIVQTKETYEHFGIGMPNNAIDDEIFTHIGKKYIISNMHRTFPFIDLRVGQVVSNHTLIYNDQDYRIADYTGQGAWTRLAVQKINLWEMMKGVNILGGKK